MKIEMVPISKLTLLENNPRRISKDQMAKLVKSIQDDPEFLKCRPILVNSVIFDGINKQNTLEITENRVYIVYAGNQRVRAAKKLKMKEVPCIIEFDLPEVILKSRIIKDNKTFGEFDFDILANEWDIDILMDCGFTAHELVDGVKDINPEEEGSGKEEEETKACELCGHKLKK